MTAHAIDSGSSTTATHCPYCAFQCGMLLTRTVDEVSVSGNPAFPVNAGALCIKGWTATATLTHPDRLRTPLARDRGGSLVPVTWNEAIERVVQGIRAAQQRYGREAAGVFGGGSLTNEKAYLLGKFARLVLGTPHIDYNGRFCMSSAAAAGIRAFGMDRGLPFPVRDIAQADAILLAGSNLAETMPPMMRYFDAQRAGGGGLIVADPRRSATTRAMAGALHLKLTPGSDTALANGLLHLLVREGFLDKDFLRERTEGFERVKAAVASYWPERVERITGVPESDLVSAAYRLGTAASPMVLTARGAEQHSQGVANTLAYINLALALGRSGRPFTAYGCLTGQGNGQGGREHGQKSDQLPGYRRIDDPAARAHLAAVWGVAESEIPGPGRSAYELLDSLGCEDGVRTLLVMGSNVVVSAPNALHVQERLRALDFLVVADFFLSETARLADVVLPTAQWAEEEGTMTNLEGRVILRRQAVAPPQGVRTDIEVIGALAAAFGRGNQFPYREPRDVFEELRRASAGGLADYAGITYERIEASGGVFWPCPTTDHPGTERPFAKRFATPNGKARFHAVRHQPPAEEPSGEYPLYLTTGRVLAHYQSGTQTRRVAALEHMAPDPIAEMHPRAAQRAGLSEGDTVRLSTRRGDARCTLRLTTAIREDTVFAPFHWGGQRSVNRLTNPALDPVSRMPEFKVCAVRVERLDD